MPRWFLSLGNAEDETDDDDDDEPRSLVTATATAPDDTLVLPVGDEAATPLKATQISARPGGDAALVAVVGIFLLLQTAFNSWRLAALAFLALPAALVGVLAAYAGDRIVSLGSLVGFLAVLGIA